MNWRAKYSIYVDGNLDSQINNHAMYFIISRLAYYKNLDSRDSIEMKQKCIKYVY